MKLSNRSKLVEIQDSNLTNRISSRQRVENWLSWSRITANESNIFKSSLGGGWIHPNKAFFSINETKQWTGCRPEKWLWHQHHPWLFWSLQRQKEGNELRTAYNILCYFQEREFELLNEHKKFNKNSLDVDAPPESWLLFLCLSLFLFKTSQPQLLNTWWSGV